MIKLVNILKEIRVLGGGTSKVFIGVTSTGESTELYKLDPFPVIINQKDVLKNSLGFRNALTLVLNEAYGDSISQSSLEEFIDSGITITFLGNFSSPLSKAYVYADAEGSVAIVDSLDKFGDDYQDEQNWGVFEWKEITPIPTIKEITITPAGGKITAYFDMSSQENTHIPLRRLYGKIKIKDNPILPQEFLTTQMNTTGHSARTQTLPVVIPLKADWIKAGFGIILYEYDFSWGHTRDTAEKLIELLKKKNVNAFLGRSEEYVTVWIPKINTNIVYLNQS